MTDPLTLYRLFNRGRTIGTNRHVKCFNADHSITKQSYDQFVQDVLTLIGVLQYRGLKLKQRVATLATNSIRHLQLMWAVPLAGGVFHAINTRLSIDEISYILEDANDQILFIEPTFTELVIGLRQASPDLELIYLSDDVSEEFANIESLLQSGIPELEYIKEVTTNENDPAVLCYTSGTTGRPKGVSYSHRALTLHAMMEMMVDGYGIRNSDHVLLMVPFCHGAAWGVPYSAFMSGADISILSGPIRANHVADILKQQNITFTAAIPEVIAQVAQEIATRDVNLSGLRILMGGTAPSPETLSILQKAEITSMLCWGMTETLSAATMQKLPPGSKSLSTTQGIPLPLTELSLAENDDGSKELLVRGPCVIDRYYGHELSARQNGWFATGDMADIDADGTLYFHDRKKDLIKSGGEWISPAALETVVLQMDCIRECVIIGVPHPKWGERPLCVVLASELIEIEQIHQTIMDSGQFAKWQLPDEIIFLDELPRTSLGKLDRQALHLKFKNHYYPSSN